MSALTPPDSFRLGRLRLIRLPPSSLRLAAGSKKAQTVSVELAAGVTDDYGTDLEFDSLKLRIELLDARTFEPPTGVTMHLEGSPSSSSKPSTSADFAFTPVRGPFHTLKLLLTFSTSFTTHKSTSFCFRLRVPSCSRAAPPIARDASDLTTAVRAIIGEPSQVPTETWDDRSYVFLSVTSGSMEVAVEGKEATVAPEKVQTAIRLIHLTTPVSASSDTPPLNRPSVSASPSTAINIVERPGLNNSTGQRLWDCAIGLCAFLSLHPSALDASCALPSSSPPRPSSEARAAKKPRIDAPTPSSAARRSGASRVRVVELGAGCALASLAAARVLHGAVGADASVLATDVETTVGTTLRENLAANAGAAATAAAGGKDAPVEVKAEVLDWGQLTPAQVDALVAGAGSVTLLGTDILYNPSSHGLLLATLLSVLRPAAGPCFSSVAADASVSPFSRRALIAYKRRTEGDDGFFELARSSGLKVGMVWEWGEVSVWSFE